MAILQDSGPIFSPPTYVYNRAHIHASGAEMKTPLRQEKMKWATEMVNMQYFITTICNSGLWACVFKLKTRVVTVL